MGTLWIVQRSHLLNTSLCLIEREEARIRTWKHYGGTVISQDMPAEILKEQNANKENMETVSCVELPEDCAIV